VIGNGRIIAEGSIADVVSRRAPSVFVRAERQSEFARQLASRGAVVDGTPGGG
jgi:hypothetical protein